MTKEIGISTRSLLSLPISATAPFLVLVSHISGKLCCNLLFLNLLGCKSLLQVCLGVVKTICVFMTKTSSSASLANAIPANKQPSTDNLALCVCDLHHMDHSLLVLPGAQVLFWTLCCLKMTTPSKSRALVSMTFTFLYSLGVGVVQMENLGRGLLKNLNFSQIVGLSSRDLFYGIMIIIHNNKL